MVHIANRQLKYKPMFRLFRKTKTTHEPLVQDWSFLQADMHSHFIPGIDDGAQTIEDSLFLLRGMQQQGFRKLVTTPHISADYYPNKQEDILSGLDRLREAAASERIDIELAAAAEYMIDEAFMEMVQEKKPLLTFGDQHILVEMGFVQASPLLEKAIFDLQVAGYKPVLAHPERYNYYHGNTAILEGLKEHGVHMQLNIIALSGYYGKPVKMQAEQLLQAGLYNFAGSDIHHERHLRAFNSVLTGSHMAKLADYAFLNKIL